jgi:hypothetical protein
VKLLLRVVLTLLLVFVAVKLGIMFAPRLASLTGDGRRGTVSGPRSPVSPVGAAQPDWGGGRLSVSDRSASGVIDSVKMASGEDRSRTETFSGSASGVLLRQKSDSDYALTIAMSSPGEPGRTALFEMPSSNHFRKELLPGDGDAEPPAPDIPLYPRSSCRMQVGRGTATFIGFYLTSDSVEAVRSFYVRALGKLGWQWINPSPPSPLPLGEGREVRVLETFTKRNADRSVVLQLRRQDSITTRIGLIATTSGSPDRSERK